MMWFTLTFYCKSNTCWKFNVDHINSHPENQHEFQKAITAHNNRSFQCTKVDGTKIVTLGVECIYQYYQVKKAFSN